MAVAAARIAVDLLNQLAHGVHAVAEYLRRIAAGGSHKAIADNQHAVIVAG